MSLSRVDLTSGPMYIAAASTLLVFVVLSWRIPSGKSSSPTRYSHFVTSVLIAALVTLFTHFLGAGGNSGEVFDTNPPIF
jgi:hypothetical protein